MFHPRKGEAGRGESQGEEGEEEAEDWDEDVGNVFSRMVQIKVQVDGNPSFEIVPPANVCHAEAISNDAQGGDEKIEEGELGREDDEGLLCLLLVSIFV